MPVIVPAGQLPVGCLQSIYKQSRDEPKSPHNKETGSVPKAADEEGDDQAGAQTERSGGILQALVRKTLWGWK